MVKVNGEESDPIPVTSGVPQGTVLAGTLFICTMKTINENVTHSKVSSYADDTKLLHRIRGKTDELKLQEDLVMVYNWATENNMMFNGDKFQVLRYGCTKNSNDPEYKAPNGASIPVHEHVKDLGVWMSSKGSFEYHINYVVQRASNMAGWVLTNENLQIQITNSYAHSIQDHGHEQIGRLFTSLSPKIFGFSNHQN